LGYLFIFEALNNQWRDNPLKKHTIATTMRSGCVALPLTMAIGPSSCRRQWPYFHAIYGEYEITVDIESGILNGRIPQRALKLVFEWLELDKDESPFLYRVNKCPVVSKGENECTYVESENAIV
jgi:hypothetical protein